jgi:ABC-2 type transport system permease protein
MFRGLLRLSWLETKIFLREPLGALGALVFPVLGYLVIGRLLAGRTPAAPQARDAVDGVRVIMPVMGALLISISAVVSLVAIIAVYREGGILKRLRATPLRPWTILTAHVLVKLVFTALTLLAMVLAGRRYYPSTIDVPFAGLAAALLLMTLSVLAFGFVIASLVPTARFAQPVASFVFYPMIALSGLFFPIERLPASLEAIARVLPLTPAVSLLRGVILHDGWSAHLGDIVMLVVYFVVFIALSSRVFRWE